MCSQETEIIKLLKSINSNLEALRSEKELSPAEQHIKNLNDVFKNGEEAECLKTYKLATKIYDYLLTCPDYVDFYCIVENFSYCYTKSQIEEALKRLITSDSIETIENVVFKAKDKVTMYKAKEEN